jgi:RimJ/RimL family protein N-acetyltransferase
VRFVKLINYNESIYKKVVTSWLNPEILKQTISDLVDQSKPRYSIIMALDDGTPVGIIEIFNVDDENRKCEYGVIIGDKRGSRFGFYALKKAFFSLFNEGFNRIYAKPLKSSIISFQANTLLGFKLEGVERQSVWVGDHYEDRLIMGLLKEDFERKWAKCQ